MGIPIERNFMKLLLLLVVTILSSPTWALTCFSMTHKIGEGDTICTDESELDFRHSYSLILASRYQQSTSVKILDVVGLQLPTGTTAMTKTSAIAQVSPFDPNETVALTLAQDQDRISIVAVGNLGQAQILGAGKFQAQDNVGGAMPLPMGGMGSRKIGMFEQLGVFKPKAPGPSPFE
jgi:hypothetical protein